MTTPSPRTISRTLTPSTVATRTARSSSPVNAQRRARASTPAAMRRSERPERGVRASSRSAPEPDRLIVGHKRRKRCRCGRYRQRERTHPKPSHKSIRGDHAGPSLRPDCRLRSTPRPLVVAEAVVLLLLSHTAQPLWGRVFSSHMCQLAPRRFSAKVIHRRRIDALGAM